MFSKRKKKMNPNGCAFNLEVNYLIGYEGRKILGPLT